MIGPTQRNSGAAAEGPGRGEEIGRALAQAGLADSQDAQWPSPTPPECGVRWGGDTVRHDVAPAGRPAGGANAVADKFRSAEDGVGGLPFGTLAGGGQSAQGIRGGRGLPIGEGPMLAEQQFVFHGNRGDGLLDDGPEPALASVTEQLESRGVERVNAARVAEARADDRLREGASGPQVHGGVFPRALD